MSESDPPPLLMVRSWRRAGYNRPVRVHAVREGSLTALCGMTTRADWPGTKPAWDPTNPLVCPKCLRLAAQEATS